ncbi:MAG: GFA family protein [Phenylobacterium sp.]
MLQGGCACGAVRYRLKTAPMIVHCCHCRDCQRQTGGPCAVNALIETDRIELLGEAPVAISMPTDSGRPHDIERCATCEVALWSDYGRRGWMKFVRATTLDDPDALAPDVHIFTRSKLPWVGLPANVPAYEVFYATMDEVWSPEALARREAASKGAR